MPQISRDKLHEYEAQKAIQIRDEIRSSIGLSVDPQLNSSLSFVLSEGMVDHDQIFQLLTNFVQENASTETVFS